MTAEEYLLTSGVPEVRALWEISSGGPGDERRSAAKGLDHTYSGILPKMKIIIHMRLLVQNARLLWFEVRIMTGGTTGSRIILHMSEVFNYS